MSLLNRFLEREDRSRDSFPKRLHEKQGETPKRFEFKMPESANEPKNGSCSSNWSSKTLKKNSRGGSKHLCTAINLEDNAIKIHGLSLGDQT